MIVISFIKFGKYLYKVIIKLPMQVIEWYAVS